MILDLSKFADHGLSSEVNDSAVSQVEQAQQHQSPLADKAETAGIVTLEVMEQHAKNLSQRLQRQRLKAFPPVAQRTFRKLTSGEVAKLLGVADGYLRQLSLDGKGPAVEVSDNGRRLYSLRDVAELRAYMEANSKTEGRYIKHRRQGEYLQVIACTNFKGGSAKTTTTAHLAQYLALNGYRVLAIDLDPQASLTALHGYHPEFDIGPSETFYGTLRYGAESRHPAEIIRKTYIEGLDIIPANLELMEFEHDTPKALQSRNREDIFFNRITLALSVVADQYDIVVIDCPPQLGFLTLAAMSAATGIVITVHPQMMDVMSMAQFLKMTTDMLRVIRDAGGKAQYDWMKYLVTRYEPNDRPQSEMVAFLRQMYTGYVLEHEMLKSTAIEDAGITKQTIYEAKREQFSKSTLDRALDAMNAVNAEIETLIQKAWGRI